MLYPLPTLDKRIRYQLVARICSTLETGSHFTTNIKTTNEMVFKVDGMQMQTHYGIQNISQHAGGHARHLNTKDKKDLSEIAGLIKNTVAVFYVLDMGSYAQELFFSHQKQSLQEAVDLGPIHISSENDFVQFHSTKNSIDTWIVCMESDITWNSNLSRLNWEYKVTLL